MSDRGGPKLKQTGVIWGLCVLLLYTSPLPCSANSSQATELLYQIKEGSPRGTLIAALGKDLNLDFTLDPPLLFNLPQKQSSERFFQLNGTTGELYASGTGIDREALCPESAGGGTRNGRACVLSLDVFVLPQRRFQLVKVKIVVEDVNDNRPRFPVDEIRVHVPENAAVNARYAVEQSAADPDVGAHGVQTYWLVDGFGAFALDVEESESGELTPVLIVTEELDRETRAEYVTDIVAEDGGSPPLLGTATLRIIITDVNDNCPRFSESRINVTVYGNATKGARLAQLRAFDPDRGANAAIAYAYSERVPRDARTLFHLDKLTGLIKLARKTDAATTGTGGKLYRLTVLANGPGCVPAVASVAVRVVRVATATVTGPPVVVPRYIAAEKDGVLTVRESEPPFTPIAFFTVENADTQKHKVECRLEGSSSSGPFPFRLTPYAPVKNEYLLETTEPLDYEERRDYELTVVARDDHSGLVAVETLVRVRVSDENDNAPVFRQSLVEVSVEENNAPGAFLARLQASDRDSGVRGEVVYLLGADAPASLFSLDRRTGVLTAAASLDREERETHRFAVRAADGGTPRRESVATVIVTVLDRNDNTPRFADDNKDLTFFVAENFPAFGEVGELRATDADAGRNGRVALHVVDGNDSDAFVVVDAGGRGGVLRAKTPLDREQQGAFHLWVEATDGGDPPLSCVAMVTVLLLDVNDNPPVVLFPQSNQSYMLVLPDTPPGTSVTEVYAVDRDAGMNAVIAYSIVDGKGGAMGGASAAGAFDIDPGTGNITLRRLLSDRRGLYSLLVRVSDHGQPEPLYSVVVVNLFVNETVGNESYVQSLLTGGAEGEGEGGEEERAWHVGQLTERPERERFPCRPLVIALSVACLGLLLAVVALTSYACCGAELRRRRREKRREKEGASKTNGELNAVDRKLMEIANI